MGIYTKESLEELTSSPTDFSALDQGSYEEANRENLERFADDKRLYVEFFLKPKRDELESVLQQRPIFQEVAYLRVLIPGDKLNQVVRPATSEDLQRFSVQFERFKKGIAQNVGTPLTEVGFLDPAKIEELKFFHVVTVEQLAGLSETTLQKLGAGWRSYVEKAKAWLNKSLSSESLLERIQKLERDLAEANASVAAQVKADVKASSETEGAAHPQLPKKK